MYDFLIAGILLYPNLGRSFWGRFGSVLEFVGGFADGNGGELVSVGVEVLPDGRGMVRSEVAQQPGDGFGDENVFLFA
ncbi:MAG TPA: hypothetical protein VNV35_03540 [Puia sp.]|jgi:hypothetical protein|nr:hypothetical protein [Puia sp.]